MAKKHMDKNQGMPKRNDQANAGNNAAQNDEQFPGYPHYAPKEDIMDGRSDTERVNVDVEGLPSFHNAGTPHRLRPGMEQDRNENSSPAEQNVDPEADLRISMGTEADVTAEERMMLEDDMYYPTRDEDSLRQARLDDTDFDGEKLNEESFGPGQAESGADLDMDNAINGTNDDSMGQGDEENQYWSLGGDAKDGIVEGTP